MTKILDGKKLRDELTINLKKRISQNGVKLKLVIIQVGDLAESNLYIAKKKEYAKDLGIEVIHGRYNEKTTCEKICDDIAQYNKDISIQGIMIQLPLPESMDADTILNTITPAKDVDGLTSSNLRRLLDNDETFLPATTKGIMILLEHYNISLTSKRVAIIGQSSLVGRPTALAFLNRKATVTICNSNTANLENVTKNSDIIVSAVGQANLVTKQHISNNQVIIDVGTNITDSGETIGDVAFDQVKDLIDAITPVPGGVGPMTVYSLMENLVHASTIYTHGKISQI